jgi:ribosomal protein L37AE/L43A
VNIEIYAKPKYEQPDLIRDNFDNIERRLKQIGVTFFVRPGMHEKVGIVDEKILWHGSLNILSHNSTKESMLRFESAELVNEIIADLGLGQGKFELREDLKKIAESAAAGSWGTLSGDRQCPVCDGTMHFYDKTELWICDKSPRCPGTLSEEETALERAKETEFTSQPFELDCPICNSLMEIKRGIVTRIACVSNSCNFSLDSRLSSGLIRISRKKFIE